MSKSNCHQKCKTFLLLYTFHSFIGLLIHVISPNHPLFNLQYRSVDQMFFIKTTGYSTSKQSTGLKEEM